MLIEISRTLKMRPKALNETFTAPLKNLSRTIPLEKEVKKDYCQVKVCQAAEFCMEKKIIPLFILLLGIKKNSIVLETGCIV